MEEKTIVRIRKGLSGFEYSICTGDGYLFRNVDSIEEIREYYKPEIRAKRVQLVKELDMYPEGSQPQYTVYGYARVSTRGQAVDGNSLDAQEQTLKDAGAQVVYREAFTGTVKDRPELKKLLETIKGGDILIVTKMDRLGRSIGQVTDIINDLLERRITVHILNMGKLNNSPQNKLMRSMLLAFAEFERDMIVERTQEGKAIARTKDGFREGRPRLPKDRMDLAMALLQDNSYKAVSGQTGISVSTLVREKKRRGL